MTAWRNYYNSGYAKYKNHKTVVDGIQFDSRKEARRWQELKLAEAAGAIGDLQRQVRFELIPVQREPDTRGPKGGLKQGRVIERKVEYVADFVYTDLHTGSTVVEDTKGMRTKDFVIKRKLMLYMHGIRVKEI